MPRSDIDVFYVTLPVDSADQALSLAAYLGQHGMTAVPEGNDSVVCPMVDPTQTSVIHQLRTTWCRYWEHSDAALFDLPVLVRDQGCPQCGCGPRVE